MLGSSSRIDLDVDVSGIPGLKRVSKSIDNVKDELNELAAANTTTAQATRNNTAAQGELSGGLAGLQAQLASTRAAQEALGDETADLSDLFDDFDDRTSNVILDSLVENFDDISDNLDEIGLGEFDEELNSLNTHELRDVMRYTAGIDDNLGMIENRSFGATSDEISDIVDTTTQVATHGQGDLFNVLFGDNQDQHEMRISEALGDIWGMTREEALSLDQSEIAEMLQGPLDPEEVQNVIQDEYSGMTGLRDADLDALSREFSPHGEDGPFSAPKFFQASDDRLKEALGRDVDVESIRSRLLGTLYAAGGEDEPISELRGTDASEIVGTGVPQQLLDEFNDEEKISRLLEMDEETMDRILDQQLGGKRGDLTVSDVRAGVLDQLRRVGQSRGINTVHDPLQGMGRGDPDLSALRERLEMPEPADQSSVSESEIQGPIAKLQRLIGQNAEFGRLAREADDFDEFFNSLQSLEGDNIAEFVQTLKNDRGALSEGFENLAQSVDGVSGSLDSMADVADAVDEEFAGTMSDLQTEILARIAGDMDGVLPQKRSGTNVPMTYEALEMELFQELLDSDSQTRKKSIQGILEQLYSGRMGEIGTDFPTLMQNETFREQDMRPTLRDSLPDNFEDEDIDAILDQFAESNTPITHMLGDDAPRSVDEEIVGPALKDRRRNIGPDAMSDASRAVESAMRDALYGPGSQSAPGVLQTLNARDDMELEDLLPGEDVLTGSMTSDRRQKAARKHSKTLGDAMEKIRDTQMDFMPGLGMTGGEADGSRRQRRGLFGMGLQQAPRVLQALDKLGDGDGFMGKGGVDTGRNVRRVSEAFQGLRSTLDMLSPMIDLTSINLGPLNARFESAVGMVTKLTALLGPLIVGLAGVAGGAVAAAGALGALVGVGAIQYLGEMEDRMAGVSNKQEAMEQLMQTLRDMAFEAITPLREVELADGRSAMQVFVDTVRGGLVYLNKISNVIASIVSMPVFSEQLERLSALFMSDPRESGVLENLRQATQDALPIVAGLLEYIVQNLDDFAVFAGEVMQILAGGDLTSMRDSLASIARVSGVVIKFGAGLINMTITLLGLFAKFAGVIVAVVDGLISIANIIPGVNVGVEDMAVLLGELVAITAVLGTALGSLLLQYAAGVGIFGTFGSIVSYLAVGLKGLVATIGGVIGVSTGWAAVIIGLVAILADFVYYLATGESAAGNFLRTLEQWTGIDFFGDLAQDIENIYNWIQKVIGAIPEFIRNIEKVPGVSAEHGATSRAGLANDSPYVGGGNTSSSGGATTGTSRGGTDVADTAMSAAASAININVNASRNQRDLARMIRKEIRRFTEQSYGN